MPRFAILRHEPGPNSRAGLHWDLMLEPEEGGPLYTWALGRPPANGSTIEAEQLAPHRRHYLSYEGPVSGDRGTVRQWDVGALNWLRDSPFEIAVELLGEKASWKVRLVQHDHGWRATFATLSGGSNS